jgi:hypothetical protein
MQNKANFPDVQINVSIFPQKHYENKWQRRVRKNKPNSKPIQSQSNPIKANFKGKNAAGFDD